MFSLRTTISWKMLAENRLRFILSILGIGAAIAIIFVNQGFQDGLLRQVKVYPLNSGADIYVSQEGVDSFIFGFSTLQSKLKAQILKTDGVSKVTGIVTSMMIFKYKDQKSPSIVIGYDSNKKFGGPWKLKEGRYLKKNLLYKKNYDSNSKTATLFSKKQVKPKEVILDFNLSQKYGLKIGDIVEIQDYNFKIVGLSEGTTSWIVSPIFMSREDARSILKKSRNVVSYFLVTVKSGFDPLVVKSNIIQRSADSRRISDRISGIEVFTAKELAEKDENFTREFFVSMMGVVTFMTYIIGILIIGLVIYILTLEKIKEYAILKAVGAKNRQIFLIVLIQTFISSTLGFIIGISIAKGFEYLTTSVIATSIYYCGGK